MFKVKAAPTTCTRRLGLLGALILIWLGKNELGQLDAPAMPVEEKKPTELRIVRPGDVKAAEA